MNAMTSQVRKILVDQTKEVGKNLEIVGPVRSDRIDAVD
jgi:hypothetical protein